MKNVWAIALAVVLSTACNSTTETTSKSQPLTAGSGDSGGSTGTGTSGNTPTANAAGLVSNFDPNNSLVRGYAYDANRPNVSFMVELWLDAPRPSGIALGQILANANRFLFPTGPHGFNFTVPMAYQDGKIRQIYVYSIDPNNGARNELGNSPMAFWAGVNLVGKQYFDQNVAIAITNNCVSCHSTMADYLSAKTLLASPSKFSLGSATNNELMIRSLGVSHGGGNRCGNANSSPCSLFQTWWAREFN